MAHGGTARELALAVLLIIVAAGCDEKATEATAASSPVNIPAAPTMSPDASAGEQPKQKLPVPSPDENLTNVKHHGLVQRTLGFYAVLLPEGYANSDQAYPLVVILHGSGSTELRHGSLANDFGREQAIYVAPRAPHPHHGAFTEGGTPGWTAWPTYPKEWGKWGSPEFPLEQMKDADPRRLYVDWIAAVVDDVRRQYRVAKAKAVVYGHSQGAAFAHEFAVQRPDMVKAYFAFAGYYDPTTEAPELATHALALKKNRVKIALAHHEGDDVVKVDKTRLLSEYFTRHGVEHATHILPGGTHRGSPEIKLAAREFISRECCAKLPTP